MKLKDFFDLDLNSSLLVGYYGGGNFGDELLLEVLFNLFKEKGVSDLNFYYSNTELYPIFHHDFGYTLIDAKRRPQLIKSLFRSRNIIIGGGGLWGLDFNKRIFFLSIVLFFARFLLGKKVYLLGIGYYDSVSFLGRISAFIAGLSANAILARDQETQENFSKFASKTSRIDDIAFALNDLDLSDYKKDLEYITSQIKINDRKVFITIRRFQVKYNNSYLDLVLRLIKNNPTRHFIFSSLEPREVDPDGFKLLEHTRRTASNVQAFDFRYNPIALYLYFRTHSNELLLIAPQYHALLIASLSGVKYLPLFYDNKCKQLLAQVGGGKPLDIYTLKIDDVQKFVDANL